MDSFFEDIEQKGSFLLQTKNLPSDAVFRARCLDSPRTRRIRPVSVTRVRDGYEVRMVACQTAEPVQEAAPESAEPVPQAAQPGQEHESLRKSLNDRIRALTVSERVVLALKADLLERRILMQENNFKINEFLLRNSRITDQEIAFMARNPTAPMQTILAIANRKEWMTRDPIRSGILLNPRTPANIVMDILPNASTQDILKMFHSKHLREDIQGAVRLEMKKRGIKPKKVAD
ncbi:MAG TPA: hypothetical protein VLR94_01715 [Acidobacteriota bacterium]|nr:hypothetical protein [Acidobacteriota bacterium]